ncbi:YpjP family protein [Barrientosiimonas marina]|uniref:YpjP family protein n=1 Tax=Lentibacillus kimchii TaxID=1542911 RepID=A0ABW2URG1_9BACI
MKLWMRKISVALIAFITLGLYVPGSPADVQADPGKETADSHKTSSERADHDEQPALTATMPVNTPEDPVQDLHDKAREQALLKMGPRIVTKVEDDFEADILPKMEEALDTIFDGTEARTVEHYHLTKQPSSGFGERIFDIYDDRSKEAVARFDVRRENRPMEGYWFNFHYHVKSDGFTEHHAIGEIYWDKNKPPKWMA